MTSQTQHLLNEALQLPEGERSDLTARLLESFDPGEEPDVETCWDNEIQKRLAELEAGQVQPIAWPQARALIVDDTDDTDDADKAESA